MPLGDFLRRASTYILGLEEEKTFSHHYEDNEILFCKNNVCVHPPSMVRRDPDLLHHAGYLTVTTKVFVDQYTETKRPTLFLTWIPNSTLSKSPNTVQNFFILKNGYHKRISSESLSSNDSGGSFVERQIGSNFQTTNPFSNSYNNEDTTSEGLSSDESDKEERIININVDIANPEIEILTTPDSMKDMNEHLEKFKFSRLESMISNESQYANWNATPEFLAQKHNLIFPDSSSNSPILTAEQPHKSLRFSVDLSQMRSLRLFFNDPACTCGQLVVASRESQYKILHFHYGGLDHLAQVLHQWHSLLHSIKLVQGCDVNLPYRHFMTLFTEHGQLEDELSLRKYVFFSGMDKSLRRYVWPFLLHVFPYQSCFEERNIIMEIRRQEYAEITRRRMELSGNHLKYFRRNIQSIVEKDVVRTDRGNPFFAGDENPNLEIMKNILLNYSVFNPGLGYTQGMSDLLAPVLFELKDEVLAFWCFVGLMQRAVFVATPTDRDMDISLRYLRELIRVMIPKFYDHLEKHKDAMELLFCHRWILLCFKREFTEGVAIRMWEACWANYLTDYFHLFLCLAIICVYADDVIAQDLRTDEMLLHFSSLAMYMDGPLIIRKARGLLYQFRQLRQIPCTLAGLCTRCGPGIWDSSHSPRICCAGHLNGMACKICI
ncbi:TBC1 domain family member 16 isoform X2 [Coccinella septempunctata]|uniref:TBC1 domain family member 16 isoform X2 n=1 Tax=Coccinella septempunctata TaxID=41139 RepID=UPI001D07BD8C|nr:TBC1 domain family member 16 isoform X2 [Coccinella septempunctata]